MSDVAAYLQIIIDIISTSVSKTIFVLTIAFRHTNIYNINDYLQICCHITHNNGRLIILICDFS